MIKTSTLAAVAIVLVVAASESPQDAEGWSTQGRSSSAVASVANGGAAIRYVTASVGNAARYRIREQLVGLDLPNDAVGETRAVTGVIAADAKGNVIASDSRFVVDVTALKSDKERRDGFVRRRVLETDANPTVTFVPTAVKGLTLPLPRSGRKLFEVVGDLTVKGKTGQVLWKVDAQFSPDRITGTASTSFTFADYGIDQPRVPVVLSVDETIKLELDFTLVPAR